MLPSTLEWRSAVERVFVNQYDEFAVAVILMVEIDASRILTTNTNKSIENVLGNLSAFKIMDVSTRMTHERVEWL